ncbi:MAG: hypothetical protein ABWY68_05910 [Cryobacterium sp.]
MWTKLGWALGSVVAVAVLGFLVVAGLLAWHFGVTAPNGQERIAQDEREMARDAAASAQFALGSAAADGTLTDDEIAQAVGSRVWDVQRADSDWVIRANFQGTDPLCFSFDIGLPLGPDTKATRTELPSCPKITPAG